MLKAGLIWGILGVIVGLLMILLFSAVWFFVGALIVPNFLNQAFAYSGNRDASYQQWQVGLFLILLFGTLAMWTIAGFFAARAGGISLISRAESAKAGAVAGVVNVLLISGCTTLLASSPEQDLDVVALYTVIALIVASIAGAIGGARGWRRPPQITPEKPVEP